MRVEGDEDQRNENITVAAMFILLTFSIVIWYAKTLTASSAALSKGMVTGCSMVLLAFILSGLIVMLLIHANLKKGHIRVETERIRALENSQAKSRFLFNMSHDLRTPMNAIIGYTRLAMKEPVAPTVKDYLQKIDLSSQHMLTLIKDILEMTRIESGSVELDEEPADIAALFREVGDLFDAQMREKGIAFELDTSKVRHRYVYCDRKNLMRVLMSLVNNAYKFTPAGGQVAVSVAEVDPEAAGTAAFELRVRDTGIGMSESFAERMFSAFERERTSTDSGLEGTGLGLAISKSILDLMGATIDVKTALGQGTDIRIRAAFRLAEERDLPGDAAVAEAKATVEEQASAVDFSRMRLLLVEDNLINMEIAQMILTQAGFAVETAENGQVALDRIGAAEAGYYDAVLMDIQMPVMDGYTATRKIRALADAEKASVPIVAMTANAFKEDQEAAFDAGMQAHIAKPIDVNVMLETLRDVLSKRG